MKNRNRLFKRANDALKKLHCITGSDYSHGYVVGVSKRHPNYFIAMLYNKYEKKWQRVACGYISTYRY